VGEHIGVVDILPDLIEDGPGRRQALFPVEHQIHRHLTLPQITLDGFQRNPGRLVLGIAVGACGDQRKCDRIASLFRGKLQTVPVA
jgi:hypothetical protein